MKGKFNVALWMF